MVRYMLAIMLLCSLCIAVSGCGGDDATGISNNTGGEPQPDIYTGPGGNSGGGTDGGGTITPPSPPGGGTITPPAPPGGGTPDPITPPAPPLL